jgi:monoterpene epsilon-lactone hydrolase
MSSNEIEKTGVWTALPQTVSIEARFIAEALRHARIVPGAPPQTPDEWRARNKAGSPLTASPGFQAMLNIKPIEHRTMTVDGAAHSLFVPPNCDAEHDRRIVMHVHGGGYVLGAPENEAPIAAPLAIALGCPVLSIRYPLWWEALPPADVDRVVSVYRELRKDRDASSIALMGVSAGGGLALRSALKLKELGERLPAALALATPWTDVSGTGDTFTTLMPYDVLENTVIDDVRQLLGPNSDLRSPAFSPIYADYSADFPPTIIATGTRDALLSDCARLQRRLTDAGVANDLRVFEGMPHGFMGFRMPETDAFVQDFTQFLGRHLRHVETSGL